MNDKSTSSSSSGIGFVGLLTIVFITLKLLGKIDWSWWWVFSPMWISAAIGIGVLVLILGGAGVGLVVKELVSTRNAKRLRERRALSITASQHKRTGTDSYR